MEIPTVKLSVSEMRLILNSLPPRSGQGFLKPDLHEKLDFAVWETVRGRPQKILIEVVP